NLSAIPWPREKSNNDKTETITSQKNHQDAEKLNEKCKVAKSYRPIQASEEIESYGGSRQHWTPVLFHDENDSSVIFAAFNKNDDLCKQIQPLTIPGGVPNDIYHDKNLQLLVFKPKPKDTPSQPLTELFVFRLHWYTFCTDETDESCQLRFDHKYLDYIKS